MAYHRRLMKELASMQNDPPNGIQLVDAKDLHSWLVDIQVLDDNPLYNGKTFRLSFIFSTSYPVDVPQVKFVSDLDRPIPIHPHIYSNGHICLGKDRTIAHLNTCSIPILQLSNLDLLGNGWSPIQNVASITISLQSMLTGNDRNERPPDNDRYVSHAPQNPKLTK